MPPRIHRTLLMVICKDGVGLRPTLSAGGSAPEEPAAAVMIRWGVRGKVETWQGASFSEAGEEEVELGGILGIVRLWNGESSVYNEMMSLCSLFLAAYLLVFLPPSKRPSPLFPNHIEPDLPADDEALRREASASTHELHSLGDIHAVPLMSDLAKRAFDNLTELHVSIACQPFRTQLKKIRPRESLKQRY